MSAPTPNEHSSGRVPWLPTDGGRSEKHVFLIGFGFFLCGLLAIAFRSYTNGKDVAADQRYRWHFLGGKQYNHILGTFTLFSTIFSAITIAGVPYEASVAGWFSLRWLTSGIWVGIGAMVVVPRAYRMNAVREYDCPNDFVSDRWNNRILSLTTCLIGAASVFIYMVTQFYAMSTLLPAFSTGLSGTALLERDATTWILGVVVILCEWMGGFDAVTWTDMVQSVVLILAFISIPCVYDYHYGGLAGASSVLEYNCDNYFELNCTDPAFAAFNSPCATASAPRRACRSASPSASSRSSPT